MKAYSEDLRLRVLAAVDGGMPRSEVVRVRRWIRRGLIKRIPGIRIIVITKAECDRFLREQTDIAQLAA